MHYIIFPEKDATIYSKYGEKNTGLDQILELLKLNTDGSSGSNEYSRILLKYDVTEFSQSISDNNITGSKFYLNLYTAKSNQKGLDDVIYVYPISSSSDWEMGTGTFDTTASDGASWEYKTELVRWTNSGSDFLTSPECSSSYGYYNFDIRIDVTDIVNEWISGNIENNGFLLKRSDFEEFGSNISYGKTSFYSMDTHTLYVPQLEMVWNDQQYDTSSYQYYYSGTGTIVTTGSLSGTAVLSGSLSGSGNISGSFVGNITSGNFTGNITTYVTSSVLEPVQTENISINMKNLKSIYKRNSLVKLWVIVKESYHRKTFFEKIDFNIIKYLPENFFYQIQDAYNGRIMVPFSEYNKVSLGNQGHFFKLNLSGFMPERFYKIVFKVILTDGSELYFDNNFVFKVVK